MLFIPWLLVLILMIMAYKKKPTLAMLYFFAWCLLLVNVVIGPLSYPNAYFSFDAVFLLVITIAPFFLGYALILLTTNAQIISDISRKKETLINKIGASFALSWVIGGVLYAAPFLMALDLYGLRISYVYGEKDVTFFSQIGSILSGFAWFIVARIAVNQGAYSSRFAKITLLSFILIPVFMAGRQIYFQLILMLVFGIILSSRYKIQKPLQIIQLKKFILLFFMIAAFLILTVTLLRFSGEANTYSSKVEQFNMISGAVIGPSYISFFDWLPVWIVNIIVEFDYYFSAQLINLLERITSSDILLIDYNILEKSPFIKANIEKICGFYNIACFNAGVLKFSGTISESAWGTALSTNYTLFGIVGTAIINCLFGAVCSLSQRAFNYSPNNFIASNFLIANSIVLFYSIMDSIFNEIYFIVYYILSLILFVANLRLKIKLGKLLIS